MVKMAKTQYDSCFMSIPPFFITIAKIWKIGESISFGRGKGWEKSLPHILREVFYFTVTEKAPACLSLSKTVIVVFPALSPFTVILASLIVAVAI